MGTKGYKHPGRKHSVVAVNPDGSIAGYFEFIKDAVDKYGMDRHSITDSCKRGTICRGLRWWYEEEFREIYLRGEFDKLKYTLDPNRDRLTYHFKKGHKFGNGWDRCSEEKKQKRRELARKRALQMIQEGKKNFAKPRMEKPVRCITTGKEYDSLKTCSADTGIASNQIGRAARLGVATHKKRFEFIGSDERLRKNGVQHITSSAPLSTNTVDMLCQMTEKAYQSK
ncbi:hypothetical protein [uncultured Bacteroides sp.]|uniref:hypothetical protein n=1 Tax=uncultured Bacteroides sp. TaxID=162156 RepID=UPI0025AE4AC5|nr:hypothetical protein [uncultured Bacteroides sp.]